MVLIVPAGRVVQLSSSDWQAWTSIYYNKHARRHSLASLVASPGPVACAELEHRVDVADGERRERRLAVVDPVAEADDAGVGGLRGQELPENTAGGSGQPEAPSDSIGTLADASSWLHQDQPKLP